MPQDTSLLADMVTTFRQELEGLRSQQACADAGKARGDQAKCAVRQLQDDILLLHQELGLILQKEG